MVEQLSVRKVGDQLFLGLSAYHKVKLPLHNTEAGEYRRIDTIHPRLTKHKQITNKKEEDDDKEKEPIHAEEGG